MTASLAQIVLSFEVIVVALATLVVLGLRELPLGFGLVGGGVLLAMMVAAAALATRPIGILLGWAAQALFVLAVFVNFGVGLVGVIFAAIWTYSMVKGRQIDRRGA